MNKANSEMKYQLGENEADTVEVLQDLADAVTHLWDVRDEKHVVDDDILEASMLKLCFAQDALETEVQQLKDVGKHDPFEEMETTETSNLVQQNILHTNLKTEVQSLSKAIQLDQVEIMEQQKKLASEQMEVMNRLEAAESKTTELKKQSEKLKATSEEISSKEEVWLVRNSVGKLTSLFGIQLILFGLVVYLFLLQLSYHEKEAAVACT